ncbi:MAG: hypothetical protein EOP24_30085 [Hyphomicrobiales bacterium]|nr:MAG: hypothetical protein EOP24_30085 [Hyphomicrobiales bacterium]
MDRNRRSVLISAAAAAVATASAGAARAGAALDAPSQPELAPRADIPVVAGYAELRAYVGTAEVLFVTEPRDERGTRIAGWFARDGQDASTPDNGGTVVVDANGCRWKRVYSGLASVKWFGARGDGTTDDTQACKAAIVATDFLFWDPGTYVVECTSQGAALLVVSKSGLHWSGYGATIQAKAGSTGKGYCWICRIRVSRNVVIEGLTIDGNRANRPQPFHSASHCLFIEGGSDIVLRDIAMVNSTFDGICISANSPRILAQYPNKMLLANVVVENAYRNGLSITGGHGITIRGGRFSGTNGTLPEAGIDIEPDDSIIYSVKEVLVDGTVLSDNAGTGLVLTGNVPPRGYRSENVTVTKISGSNNRGGLVHVSRVSNCSLTDVAVANDQVDPSMPGIVYVDPTALNVRLRGLSFTSPSGVRKPCIYIDAAAAHHVHADAISGTDLRGPLLVAASPVHVSNVHVQGDAGSGAAVELREGAVNSTLWNVAVHNKPSGSPIRVLARDASISGVSLTECGQGVEMRGSE